MKTMKEVFKVEVDGKELELAVIRPTIEISRRAQLVYNKYYGELLKNGCLMRIKVEDYARDQGVWDNDKDETARKLLTVIRDGDKALKAGGIKLSEAKQIAIDMRIARMTLQTLYYERNQLDVNSAEGQAESEKFNYLVTQCLVYNDSGKPYFSSVEEYLSDPENPVAVKGYEIAANLIYEVDKQAYHKLPENQWLLKHKFIDDKLHLINAEGKMVDLQGREVDEEGNYVKDGKVVEEDVVEFKPFLDDNGVPLPE